MVIGVVEAWGRVEVHTDGYRAEWARPKALVSFGDDLRSRYSSARRAAEAHDLELVCVRDPVDLVRTMRARGWTGLDWSQVEDLVVAVSEVVLVPAANAYLDQDDPIGACGFRILEAGRPVCPPGVTSIPGTIVTNLEGTVGFPRGLQDTCFEPGRRVSLVCEDNLRDFRAIAIWDERERIQVGYLSRWHARRVRRLLAEDKVVDARVIWQRRSLRSGERSGLKVLISRCPVRIATADERDSVDDVPF